MGEIRIVGPGRTRGYPYPVCKKEFSSTAKNRTSSVSQVRKTSPLLLDSFAISVEGIKYTMATISIQDNYRSINGWFVGCFGLNGPFRQYFSLSERGRKKRKMIDERKMAKQPPPAPTASAVGPCPTLIQIIRTPRHWKFSQHHRTTDHPESIHGHRWTNNGQSTA